ncbi:MAG TPA: outer membrane beta-barrel protein, partial [Rhodothermales bacterium]
MKRIFSILLLTTAFLCIQQEARAQFQLGVRGGYDLETEDPVLGVEARFGLGSPSLPLIIAPAFDYYFVDNDNFNFYELDVNVLYPFGINNQTFTPYAGAGLGVGFSSVEIGDRTESDTDLGVNLVGGAVFGFGGIRPFVQARLKLG